MTAVLPLPVPAAEPGATTASSLSWAEVVRLPGSRDCAVCGQPSGLAAECLDCVLDDEISWKRRSDR